MHRDHPFDPRHIQRLNDPGRLHRQLSEDDLVRLLALHGHEDVADLGSGTGFYTDIVARHTDGTVYAIEVSPEMSEAYRQRGAPPNVRRLQADLRGPALEPASIDVAYSLLALHETGGEIGMNHLFRSLRSPGRVVVVDYRLQPDSWEDGPPASIRVGNGVAMAIFQPYFTSVTIEDLGRFMFALVATGKREEGRFG